MTFADLLAGRWSCREYAPETLPDEVLRAVFTTAQQTASWCNTQPWQVHLLSSDATAWFGKELTEHVLSGAPAQPDLPMPENYRGVYAERRREAGYARYESLGIERWDSAARGEQMLKNFSFVGAPHGAIITSDRAQGVYGAIDCGGYVANLMNAALEQGVGSIAQGAIAMHAGKVRELLALPQERVVVCAVALGRPASGHPVNRFRTTRASLDAVIQRVERP